MLYVLVTYDMIYVLVTNAMICVLVTNDMICDISPAYDMLWYVYLSQMLWYVYLAHMISYDIIDIICEISPAYERWARGAETSVQRVRQVQSLFSFWSPCHQYMYCSIYYICICYIYYPARARSARAQRASALRALGLLLSVSAPTVRWGKTFCCVGGSPSRKLP